MEANQKILQRVASIEKMANGILQLGYNIRLELGCINSRAPRKGKVRKQRAEDLRGNAIVRSMKKATVATAAE